MLSLKATHESGVCQDVIDFKRLRLVLRGQMMAAEGGALQQAKLVLLGDMGAGKSSVVLRFVKGQFFDYQVRINTATGSSGGPEHPRRSRSHQPAFARLLCSKYGSNNDAAAFLCTFGMRCHRSKRVSCVQESTIGAAFLTKTLPEQSVKFEIWYASRALSTYSHLFPTPQCSYLLLYRDTAGQERYHSLAPMYYR